MLKLDSISRSHSRLRSRLRQAALCVALLLAAYSGGAFAVCAVIEFGLSSVVPGDSGGEETVYADAVDLGIGRDGRVLYMEFEAPDGNHIYLEHQERP